MTNFYGGNAGEIGVTTGGYGGGNDYSGITSAAYNLMYSMNSGNLAAMASAMNSMAHSMSVMSSYNSLSNAGTNFTNAMNNGNLAGMANAMISMSHASMNLNSLMTTPGGGSGVNNITSSTIFTGERWGTSTRNGNNITVNQNWVGQDGKAHSQVAMTGTIDQNGHYTLSGPGGTSSGTWAGHTEQNLLNSMYDPGHEVVTSPNGDKRDIDLSDGSYVITNGNRTVGSGSKGALDITYNPDTKHVEAAVVSNLQVYAKYESRARQRSERGNECISGSAINEDPRRIHTPAQKGTPRTIRILIQESRYGD